MEIWKDIKGYEGYQVSNYGRVKSPNKILTATPKGTGYFTVNIAQQRKYIHRLVAEAFIPNPDNLPTVDHINRDKSDSSAKNLRWATQKTQIENRRDMSGEKHPNYKFDEYVVKKILRLKKAGYNVSEISRKTGASTRTVIRKLEKYYAESSNQ
jgi:DNA-binding NtrC family response regulator